MQQHFSILLAAGSEALQMSFSSSITT